MAWIDKMGYVRRKTSAIKRNPNTKSTTRNWFFVKFKKEGTGYMSIGKIGYISCPKELIGKRIKLKVELI